MNTHLDCIPCFFNQALRAARMATNNEDKIKSILCEIGMMLKDIPFEYTPAESGMFIYKKVHEITKCFDPYRKIKQESTQQALSLEPLLREKVKNAHDRLLQAIKVAVAGNVIDFGTSKNFIPINKGIEKRLNCFLTEIEDVLQKDFVICDYGKFKKYLAKTDKILFIGDNAGEAVFDKILIEELKKPVIYVVRAQPIINDVTYEDALQAGIDKVSERIISSGTSSPGIVLNNCSDEFRDIYESRQIGIIISKGQGNFEGLSEERNKPIFFLLKTKCNVVANHIGVREGDIILKGINV